MASATSTRIFRPPNRLAVLAERPGGLPRTFAVQRAERCVEAQRRPAMKALHILIDTLDAMGAAQGPLMPGELPHLRRVAGQLVSLALIYDQDLLAEAGMKLCDLIAIFARCGLPHRDPVMVHVRALRLLAPGCALPQAEAGQVLDELDRVLAYFGGAPPPVMDLPRA